MNATDPEVQDFLEAYQTNRHLAAPDGPSGYRVVVIERRKYLAVDEIPTFEGQDCAGQAGRFLVDRADGSVFTIRGYGQRGHRIGTLASLTATYRAGTATYPGGPRPTAHVEDRYSRAARWARHITA